jgi:type I restriction enzyme M protein
LFTGDAGSGESEIRKWIIENDWLEAIIALPEQLFYNTGIATYVWIVSNRKNDNLKKGPVRTGKVQLINGVDFNKKMRKSLGNKRYEICEEQKNDLTRIYGNFKENEYCKIFDNEDFGYYKITVERPLRLNFKVDDERLQRLFEQSVFATLATSKKKDPALAEREIEQGKRVQDEIIQALRKMPDKLYLNRDEFIKDLRKTFKAENLELSTPVPKAIIAALSERDEEADVCVDAKGHPEPDTELRDYEIVPLKDEIKEYFEREVKPHVPDAWIDESKTKIGYEIPFTRHFYKYTPLRPSDEIAKEILELEQQIADRLKRVMG